MLPISELRDLREGIQKPFISTIIREEGGRLRLGVLEDSENDKGNALLYYLNPESWRCVEIAPSNAYIGAYVLGLSGEPYEERLQRQFKRLKGEFRYYTGSGWSDTPVINAGYLAACNKQHSAEVDSVRNQ
jgi:hypothetical protein